MKLRSIVFLQAVIVLIGMVTLALMIRFPLTEGRAKNLDLVSIYLDPFILYGYAASILFFVALYNVFRLLGYIRQNEAFSLHSVKALRNIKLCAIVLCVLIMAAAVYIRMFHAEEDDPVGFLVIGVVAAFVSVVVATAASVVEKILQSEMDIKSENEQLYRQVKK